MFDPAPERTPGNIMLQTIHDKLKGIFAIVILVALGVVFVFWGVDVSVGSFTKARGIEVNGREIPVEEVRRSYQDELSRFEAAFGGAGVPDEMRVSMQKRALEQAVRSELIRQRTRELGFETGNQQVLEAIRQIPAFQVAGQFSADAYHAALRSINMSPEQFEAEQREFVLATQLDRGISSSAFVLPGEFERQVAMRKEGRELAWVIVPASQFAAAIEPDAAAIQAYYDAHKDRYRTEEWATVDYIELDIDTLAAGVAIDEQQLREYYESNKQRYTRPGRRHARHILIEVGDDPAAAEARAKSVYERARAGEDFAALARELSDDAGSRDAGGDLGFAERGDFDPAFADAVWDMKPGEIRGPVRSSFGWHVIRLEEIDPESTQGFDEVRAELEPELRRARVEKQFGDAQEELDTLAFEATGDLATVAAKMNLPVKRVERYTRSGTPEFGATPQVTEAVFAPEVLAGRELRTVELEPGRFIALGVSAHEPVSTRPLAEVREQVVAAARLEAAQKQASARADAVAAELKSGAGWDAATRPWQQAGTHQPGLVLRDDADVPAEIRSAAFRAPVPQGKPQYGTATTGTGDAAIWSVTAVRNGSLAALSPEERNREREQARERVAVSDASVYIAAMRANADVDVNPQVFE
jgi:peptidyl-prolyl cis-trans isomerase D